MLQLLFIIYLCFPFFRFVCYSTWCNAYKMYIDTSASALLLYFLFFLHAIFVLLHLNCKTAQLPCVLFAVLCTVHSKEWPSVVCVYVTVWRALFGITATLQYCIGVPDMHNVNLFLRRWLAHKTTKTDNHKITKQNKKKTEQLDSF